MSQVQEKSGGAHIPALDGLRGVAILLVLFIHFGGQASLPGFFHRLAYMGWMGVDLFFVLSGFLISKILLESRSSPGYFKNFYIRRALRIFPLYYFILLVGVFALPPFLSEAAVKTYLDGSVSSAGYLFTYMTNFAVIFIPGLTFGAFGHFWSLAVEEHFYLLWPTVIKWLDKKHLIAICLVIMAFSLLIRIGWLSSGQAWGGAYLLSFCRIDSLACGALLALWIDGRSREEMHQYFLKARWLLKHWAWVMLILFFLIKPFYPSHWFVVTVGLTMLAIVAACLVLICLNEMPETKIKTIMQMKWLKWFGKYSYGIYVVHFPIATIMREVTPVSGLKEHWPLLGGWLFVLAGVILSSVVALGSFHGLERPFLKMKRRFAY